MDERQPYTLTDAEIDREIQAALSVDPSPEFLARVRTSIAHQPISPRLRGVTPASCALAAVLVIAVVSVSLQDPVPADLKVSTPSAPSADLEVTTGPRAPNLNPETNAGAESPAAELRIRTAKTAASASEVVPTFRSAESRLAPSEPEVLISPDDAKAFEEFVAGVRDGRFEILLNEPVLPASFSLVAELSIPPIVIEPLDTAPAVNN
jgi:hypothetical protein